VRVASRHGSTRATALLPGPATPLARLAPYAVVAALWGAFGVALVVFTVTFEGMLVPFSVGLAGASVIPLGAVVPRLWDRTGLSRKGALERTAVTTGLVGAYAATVAGIIMFVDRDAGVEIAFALIGFAALALHPIQRFAQERVEALVFGEGGDAYEVITSLGHRLETTTMPDEVLPGVVETVATALRLPYVAIELDGQEGPVVAASAGEPTAPVVRMALTHQTRCVGWLVLATPDDGRLAPTDRRLLEALAGQIGVAARTVQLAHDLQRSHALLVAARDEERHRVQRDLHDGLGPMLAGIDLAVQAARNLVPRDPVAADALLGRVVADTRAATADVRRLVYDLRPPAIDRLGLVGALREQILRLGPCEDTTTATVPAVRIETSGDLDALPPGIELAAFRIATEGFVNVWRHARARTCTIRLRVDDADDVLRLDVVDDGIGIASDAGPGVGITSMRERAAELGGTLTVDATAAGGTRVHAVLPMPAASAGV
jgi:signal transduction histidine kinase